MEIPERGICRLSVVPVRIKPDDQHEMSNQLLFGEHYTVLENSEDGNWIKIKAEFDGYQGWIDRKQHDIISEEYFTQINNSNYKVCLDINSSIFFRKSSMQIVIGSILPISTSELFKMEEQLAFNGESKSLGQKRDFEFLKQVAIKYLNAPYLWGGKSPYGIDCSGFVQQVFKITGYKLPRDSGEQSNSGSLIKDFSKILPGDLAFFNNRKGKIAHVGIILDDGTIIHASGHVRIDQMTEKGIVNEDTKMLSHSLATIRRVLRQNEP